MCNYFDDCDCDNHWDELTVKENMDVMHETTWLSHVSTYNSGGNVMLDIIELKSGKVLIVSDECICKYDSMQHWNEDVGETIDYDKDCIEFNAVKPTPKVQPLNIGRKFVYNGVEITNPYVSECGRFDVNPIEYYGRAYRDSLKG